MLKTIKEFFKNRKANLIENIIYIIIIGGLSYMFYVDKVQTPMEANMDTLNQRITQWTQIGEE